MPFEFFALPRELRDKIYAQTWAATRAARTYSSLSMTPSVRVMARYAGHESSYESYLVTAKCLMANKAMLSEALEEFHRRAITIFIRTSNSNSAQDSNRLGSLGGLLYPLKAREVHYVPFLMAIDMRLVSTDYGYKTRVTHRLEVVDFYMITLLVRKLCESKTLHTVKLKLEIYESVDEHHRFLFDQDLACFQRIIDKGCKFEIEGRARNLLQRTHPTPHDALLVAMQMLQGITFEGASLSSTHGYDLEERALGLEEEPEDRVVYKWNFTFKKA